MKVLVVGNGGREHAIIWKLAESPKVEKIYCAIGNAGINKIAEHVDISPIDIKGLIKFVKENEIGFTVVGPEGPLAIGIVDEFTKAGLKIFGPSKAAARLENSKVFAKEFMKRCGIPTAKFERFSISEKDKAVEFLRTSNYPVVIKADGLAAGKGVVICEDKAGVLDTIKDFFDNMIFGSAGENIVVEEFLKGTEASVFAVCDGNSYVVLPTAQDHKKIGEGEKGKNTGGLGSFAPAEKAVTAQVMQRIKERIIEPVLKNMKTDGNEFKGCLYCGLMIDDAGNPFVIEFNTRFGDPETQVVMPLIKSDLLDMFIASAEGTIHDYKIEAYNGYFLCIVMASKGYPDKYESGREIKGLDSISSDCIVFHAGTKVSPDGKVLSNGGRVLNIVGRSASSLRQAIAAAYENAAQISFENEYYRTDIGIKGL
jgi:phosphoribosylamine---glycine ligase